MLTNSFFSTVLPFKNRQRRSLIDRKQITIKGFLGIPGKFVHLAVKVPGTMELRNIPDTEEDMRSNFTSAWMRSK